MKATVRVTGIPFAIKTIPYATKEIIIF